MRAAQLTSQICNSELRSSLAASSMLQFHLRWTQGFQIDNSHIYDANTQELEVHLYEQACKVARKPIHSQMHMFQSQTHMFHKWTMHPHNFTTCTSHSVLDWQRCRNNYSTEAIAPTQQLQNWTNAITTTLHRRNTSRRYSTTYSTSNTCNEDKEI